MKKVNVVYLVFGEELRNHIQAHFSILSFLVQKEYIGCIYIVTDAPRYYRNLSEAIKVVEVSAQDLNKWKGEYDFFWRIKIKAIESVSKMCKGEHVLYVDSDTFLYGNLASLVNGLDKGYHFMHLNEGNLFRLKSKTEKKMWRQLKNKKMGSVQISQQHCMWNAGVVAISGYDCDQVLNQTLSICDAMLKENVVRRLVEQFAFSVALTETHKILPADKYIGHYWGNKPEWNNYIADFFIRSSLLNKSLQDRIEEVRIMDFSKIPIYIKIPSRRYSFERLLIKLFPPRYKKFIDSPLK